MYRTSYIVLPSSLPFLFALSCLAPVLLPYTLRSCSPVSAPANTLPCVHAFAFSGSIRLCTRLFHDGHRMLLLLRLPSLNSCSDHRILAVTPCLPLSSRPSAWLPYLPAYLLILSYGLAAPRLLSPITSPMFLIRFPLVRLHTYYGH